MNFGSVCSGIDAASVAWEPLGWKASWFAEIEPFPSAVLAHHYPDVPNLGDMTKIAARVRAGEIAAPEALVGGTPCQAFSIAGLRQSLDDARGQLSLAYVDLANALDSARHVRGEPAAIIVWENVPGVLSTKDNAFGCFLGALAGEDCELKPPRGKWPNAGCVFGPKRTVAWRVLDAQYFGVAQRRRRVFVVASARDGFDPAEVLFEFEGMRRDSPPRRETGQGAAAGTLRSTDGSSDVDHARAGYLQPSCVTVMAHGQGGAEIATDRSPTLTCNHEAPIAAYSVALRGRDGGATAELGGDFSPALRCGGGGGDKPHVLAPIAFNARQDPDAWVDRTGPIDTDGSTQAVAFQDRFRGDDGRGYDRPPPISIEQIGTLETVKQWNVIKSMAVRRLTPRECERLQGFPDDYTLIPYGRAIRIEKLAKDWIKYLLRGGVMTFEQVCRAAADGPRYKALGNSMCVYNMRWIGTRIQAQLSR